MHTRLFRVRVVFLIAMAWLSAVGQVPPSPAATPIAADSPLLYHLFFRFHKDFDNRLTAQKSAVPASSASLDAGAAGLLGIKTTDLTTLSTTSKSVAANLDRLEQEEAAYVNLVLKREQRPDPATMSRYRQQREAATTAGIAELRQRLPAASYSGLLGFINGKFRASYKTAGQP